MYTDYNQFTSNKPARFPEETFEEYKIRRKNFINRKLSPSVAHNTRLRGTRLGTFKDKSEYKIRRQRAEKLAQASN